MPKVTVRRRGNADRVIAELTHKLGAGPNIVRVGFPAGRADSDLVLIAATNEFGSSDGHVPERPFLRNAIRANRERYQALMRDGAAAIVRGAAGKGPPMTKGHVLEKVGLAAVGDIQKEIASSVPPANAPSTIRQKGSSTTLIDTGRLRQGVTLKVGEDQ